MTNPIDPERAELSRLTPEKRAELSPAERADWRKAAEVSVRLESSSMGWAGALLSLLDALDAAEAKAQRLQSFWHCKVSLMPDDFAPRCEGCPDECDADDCEQEGCVEFHEKHPGLVSRGELP